MSKKRKPRTSQPSRYVQQSIFGGFIQPLSDEVVNRAAIQASAAGHWRSLPHEIFSKFDVRDIYVADLDVDGYPWKRRWTMERDTAETIMRRAMAAGFMAALQRYAAELKDVSELAAWRGKRKEGGDTGREGSTRKRVDLAQRIRDKWAAMEAAGENPTNATVAAAIKQEYGRGSIRTVQRAFAAPVKKTTPAKRTKR